MKKGSKIVCLLFVLGFSIFPVFCSESPAKEANDVGEAVERAREAGVPEDALNRILTLGYKYELKGEEIAGFVAAAGQAAEEDLPIGPLVGKMEEGLAKRVRTQVVLRALHQELSRCRFARRMTLQAMSRWRVNNREIRHDQVARLGKTLAMGISREEMEKFYREAPPAPVGRIVNALEFVAALKQSRLPQEMSYEIAYQGLKAGFFTGTAWDLSMMVAAAARKGVPHDRIAVAAKDLVTGQINFREARLSLDLKEDDLEFGPKIGLRGSGSSGQYGAVPGKKGHTGDSGGPGGAGSDNGAGSPGGGSGGSGGGSGGGGHGGSGQ